MRDPCLGFGDNCKVMVVPHLMEVATEQGRIAGSLCVQTQESGVKEHAVALAQIISRLEDNVRCLICTQ